MSRAGRLLALTAGGSKAGDQRDAERVGLAGACAAAQHVRPAVRQGGGVLDGRGGDDAGAAEDVEQKGEGTPRSAKERDKEKAPYIDGDVLPGALAADVAPPCQRMRPVRDHGKVDQPPLRSEAEAWCGPTARTYSSRAPLPHMCDGEHHETVASRAARWHDESSCALDLSLLRHRSWVRCCSDANARSARLRSLRVRVLLVLTLLGSNLVGIAAVLILFVLPGPHLLSSRFLWPNAVIVPVYMGLATILGLVSGARCGLPPGALVPRRPGSHRPRAGPDTPPPRTVTLIQGFLWILGAALITRPSA